MYKKFVKRPLDIIGVMTILIVFLPVALVMSTVFVTLGKYYE